MKSRRLYILSAICILAGILSSCDSSIKRSLKQMPEYVEVNPDSALSVLGKIDRSKLHTKRLKADYIYLNAAALEERYSNLPVSDENAMKTAAEFYENHGPKERTAKAYYYLGRIQYKASNPGGALLSFGKAADYSNDDYLSGFIYREAAKTCNYMMNNEEEVSYMRKSADMFANAGFPGESGRSLLQTGQAYFNLSDYDSAEELYKFVLFNSHEKLDTLLEVNTLQSYASLNLAKPEQDPVLAINMLARVSDQLGYPLSATDKGNLAYAYSLLGRNTQADLWLSEAFKSSETKEEKDNLNFREYQINVRKGNSDKALEALEKVMDSNNEAMNTALLQSAISSQKSYYEKETTTALEKLEAARLRFFIVVLFLFILIVIGFNYYRLQRLRVQKELSEEKAETERVMSIAEDLQKQLQEASSQPSGKMNENCEVLERLCEQFYVYEGTDNLQPKIIKEVNSIIDGLRKDPSYLEQILNERADGLMRKFRQQNPLLKEDDIRLFCLGASGLSSTTISTLFEKDKQYIYNRLYRLKGRIASSNAPDKELFLKYLSKGQ